MTPEIRDFLDKIYIVFENATLDELIELSHEDSEWIRKHRYFGKVDQRMNSMAHVEEYQCCRNCTNRFSGGKRTTKK